MLVDTDTPASVVTALKEVLDPWFEARPTELRPDPTVNFQLHCCLAQQLVCAAWFNLLSSWGAA